MFQCCATKFVGLRSNRRITRYRIEPPVASCDQEMAHRVAPASRLVTSPLGNSPRSLNSAILAKFGGASGSCDTSRLTKAASEDSHWSSHVLASPMVVATGRSRFPSCGRKCCGRSALHGPLRCDRHRIRRFRGSTIPLSPRPTARRLPSRAVTIEPVSQRFDVDMFRHTIPGAVSLMRNSESTPDANVRTAMNQIAACNPKASAVIPATSAPMA